MSISAATTATFKPWSEEPSTRPDRRKIRARIGGLHCSLCTGTIEKALGQLPGVERDLVREARRFVAAVALSVAAIPIIADPAVGWIGFLPALVCLSLGGFVFLGLRSSGLWAAVAGAGGLPVMAVALLSLNLQGYLAEPAPWTV